MKEYKKKLQKVKDVRNFYLLGMDILWKLEVLILGKTCPFTRYYVPTLTHGIEILMWNKGYNS